MRAIVHPRVDVPRFGVGGFLHGKASSSSSSPPWHQDLQVRLPQGQHSLPQAPEALTRH